MSERHGQAWSADEERQLYDAFVAGEAFGDIVARHNRSKGGIRSCLKRLGLLNASNLPVNPPPPFAATAASQKRAGKAANTPPKPRRIRLPETTDPAQTTAPDLNPRFQEALRLMQETTDHLFITGKAGTGKSTLLAHFCRTSDKDPVVLAPTGVAALNVKGQTIHRFFNFYADVTPEKLRQRKGKPRNAKIYKKLKTIIIDEVSMVRADLLDCIDAFLTQHGPRPGRGFGGVQMIFIGDLYQLPPVVTNQERAIFASHYPTPYFFSAHALRDTRLPVIELDTVYRQKDQLFVDLLNRIRNNTATGDDLAVINRRLDPNAGEIEGAITLTTTNAIADAINDTHLAALKGKSYGNAATIEGTFGREYFPTSTDLQFKLGAQIMMLNNDPDQRWVNGSIGSVKDVRKDPDGKEYVMIRLQDGGLSVPVYPHTWEVFSFEVEDNNIVSEPAGAFTQYPLRRAWAITIHKSQGKTFQRVVIDTGRGAFAAGQIYVALSRCTTLEGITLKTPVRARDIRSDPQIVNFMAGMPPGQRPDRDLSSDAAPSPPPDLSTAAKIAVIRNAIESKTPLDILYIKADGERTERKILSIRLGAMRYQGEIYDGLKAFCYQQQEELTFRLDRILKVSAAKR